MESDFPVESIPSTGNPPMQPFCIKVAPSTLPISAEDGPRVSKGLIFHVLPESRLFGDKVYLAGESYLGRLFGTFTYDAWATDGDFEANYSSPRYQGQFILRRSP
jgi:hypothetical protein